MAIDRYSGTTPVVASLVNVFEAGTQVFATIYADALLTPLGNPFTSDALTGEYLFYAENTAYDITIGTTGTPQPPIVPTGDGITQLTGDGTAGPGSGSQTLTLAASGVTAGTYGDATHVAQVTVDAKGRMTAVASVAISGGGGGGGTVTNAVTLTANRLILGNGGVDVTILGSLGTTATVLHGNAAGAPSFGAVANADLATMASGTVKANLTGGAATPTDATYAQLASAMDLLEVSTVAQGDLLYGDAPDSITTLPKDTVGVKYLSNQGTNNNPLWASVAGGSGNITSTTTVGSEPGSPASGDLDFYSNGMAIVRYSGSAWVPWGPNFPFTPPVDSDFTWVNQGGASVDTTNGGIFLRCPVSASTNYRIRKKAAPATPYVITACVLPLLAGLNFQNAGILFRQSSDGKCVAFHVLFNAGYQLYITTLNTETSPNAHLLTNVFSSFGPVWLRIADNGTNRLYSVSFDGQHFIQVYSEARTTFLTANEVGWHVNELTNSVEAGITLLSWKQT